MWERSPVSFFGANDFVRGSSVDHRGLNEAETGLALREAGPDRVHVVRAPEIIARVTAQACRQPGLSAVWQDLLDFDGDEIYFFPADDLVGRTFGEAQLGFERAAVFGRRAADGTVTIRWERTGGGATLVVRDTGIGIAAEHLPRLTERFYRVSAASSREKGGTGLGLAIVKHIVVRHRGEFRITSQLGAGSRFATEFEELGAESAVLK